MKTTVGNLQSVAKKMNPVIGKSTLPVIEGLLFQVSPGGCQVTGTNLQTTIISNLGAIPGRDEAWQAIVPFTPFASLVAALSSQEATLVFEPQKQVLTIKSGGTSSNLKCHDASEYPDFSSVPSPGSLGDTFDVTQLIAAINAVTYAAANDTVRLSLCGVHVNFDGGFVCATDGYRLGVAKLDLSQYGYPNITIPPKSARQLKAAGINLQEAQIQVAEKYFTIWDTETVLHSALVTDNYPDVSTFMSNPISDGARVDREALDGAMGISAAVKRAGGETVTMWSNGDILMMYGRAEGLSGKTSLDGRAIRGGLPQVTCQSSFLADIVKSDPEPVYTVGKVGDRIVVKGVYEHIIMPMNIIVPIDISGDLGIG